MGALPRYILIVVFFPLLSKKKAFNLKLIMILYVGQRMLFGLLSSFMIHEGFLCSPNEGSISHKLRTAILYLYRNFDTLSMRPVLSVTLFRSTFLDLYRIERRVNFLDFTLILFLQTSAALHSLR